MKKTLITLALGSLTFCTGCFTTSVTYVQPEVKRTYIGSSPMSNNLTVIFEEYHNPLERARIVHEPFQRTRVNPSRRYNNTIVITPNQDYIPGHKPDRRHENYRHDQPKRH